MTVDTLLLLFCFAACAFAIILLGLACHLHDLNERHAMLKKRMDLLTDRVNQNAQEAGAARKINMFNGESTYKPYQH